MNFGGELLMIPDSLLKLINHFKDLGFVIERNSSSLPTNEDIVRWSNEVAELTDEQNKYTATGSRIAIQERCAGARWMLTKISGKCL